MSKFTALPVGKGDAFLWERADGKFVLVDGGQSSQACLAALKARTVTDLEVVVCTHGDADHWTGLLAVLEDPAVRVGELWVPARWGDGLKELATDPVRVLEQLLDQCAKSHPTLSPHDLDTTGWDDDADHDLAQVEEAVANGPDLAPLLSGAPPWGWWWHHHGIAPLTSLGLGAVQIAGGIWKVVRKALERGVTIRWFKFGMPPSGGLTWLYPVNSVETLKVRRTTRILQWVCLTLKNSEALVLVGQTDGAPPILFSSDSDLKFDLGRVPKASMLVTAPHHGSDSNQAAYGAIQGHTGHEHIWVRSDHASKTRPGATFLGLAKERRSCTTCSLCLREVAEVRAEVSHGSWVLPTGTCTT
jgi:hypothetical protein